MAIGHLLGERHSSYTGLSARWPKLVDFKLGIIREYPDYPMIRTNETNSGYHFVPRRRNIVDGDVELFGELRARIAAND